MSAHVLCYLLLFIIGLLLLIVIIRMPNTAPPIRRDTLSIQHLGVGRQRWIGPGKKFSTPCELTRIQLVVHIGTQLAYFTKN